MTYQCPICGKPRNAACYEQEWACSFCGHVYRYTADQSPDELADKARDMREKCQEHPFQKHTEMMHDYEPVERNDDE